MPRFQGSGALSGAGTGMATGAAIGSIVPGVGTVLGGLIGGGVGAIAGGLSGGKQKEAENMIANQMSITALQQQTEANAAKAQREELDRPEISAEVDRLTEVAGLAERYAREGMPEAQRQMASDDIQRAQMNQMSAASSLGAGLRGMGNTQASTAQAYRGLAAQDAAIAQQNQGQYLGALGQLAGAESRQEAFNTVDPYYEDFNRLYMEEQAARGAAMQNRMMGANYNLMLQQQRQQATQQGVADLAGATTSMLGAGGGMDGLTSLFNGGWGADFGVVTSSSAPYGSNQSSSPLSLQRTPISFGYGR